MLLAVVSRHVHWPGPLPLHVVEFRPSTPAAALTGAAITELLVKVARGNRDAFSDLYDALSGPVFGLVRRILRDRGMSEEVTQEVFVEAWRNAPRFDPSRGSGAGWILTMAHRRAVDRVRSEQSARDRIARLVPSQTERPHDAVEESAIRMAEMGAIRAALATLSDAQRQAIELAYYGGLTQAQIAEALAIPVGTIKTRIRDGMLKLREQLESVR
jgi:RNA polymerase sigma-70 factor, ECF subfamily